jgi:hypothetical protein
MPHPGAPPAHRRRSRNTAPASTPPDRPTSPATHSSTQRSRATEPVCRLRLSDDLSKKPTGGTSAVVPACGVTHADKRTCWLWPARRSIRAGAKSKSPPSLSKGAVLRAASTIRVLLRWTRSGRTQARDRLRARSCIRVASERRGASASDARCGRSASAASGRPRTTAIPDQCRREADGGANASSSSNSAVSGGQRGETRYPCGRRLNTHPAGPVEIAPT